MFDVPDEVSARVGADRRRPRRRRRRQLRRLPDGPRRAARRPRGQRRRPPGTGPRGIISNPNCTTLSMIVALGALHRALRPARARRRVLPGRLGRRPGRHRHPARPARQGRRRPRPRAPGPATCASVGRRLRAVPRAAGAERRPVGRLAARRTAGRARSSRSATSPARSSGCPTCKVSATCVRVPVITTHSLAVHAVFDARRRRRRGAAMLLRRAPGVVLVDDPAAGEFPTPADVVGTDPTWVGRVRSLARRPARARAVRLRRQPAQGRRAQHGPDRRAGRRRALTAARKSPVVISGSLSIPSGGRSS